MPTFAIDERGVRSFHRRGLSTIPRLVGALLERNGVRAEQVTFVGHQGSRRLMGSWAEQIRPGRYLHTVRRYADLGISVDPDDTGDAS
ncbi:MAG: hypothetical protein R3F14_04720 [Polyangiaceae bacterium]